MEALIWIASGSVGIWAHYNPETCTYLLIQSQSYKAQGEWSAPTWLHTLKMSPKLSTVLIPKPFVCVLKKRRLWCVVVINPNESQESLVRELSHLRSYEKVGQRGAEQGGLDLSHQTRNEGTAPEAERSKIKDASHPPACHPCGDSWQTSGLQNFTTTHMSFTPSGLVSYSSQRKPACCVYSSVIGA